MESNQSPLGLRNFFTEQGWFGETVDNNLYVWISIYDPHLIKFLR